MIPDILVLRRDVKRMTRMVAQLLAVARLDAYHKIDPPTSDLAGRGC